MGNRKYTYSKCAERDLIKIYHDTVKEWGIAQADKYDTELENTVDLLANNPNLGRNCNEIRGELKRHEHGRHIIFYRKRKADIFIIRIIHGSMDVKRHL
jgi:toxin ParE1/3/4